MTPVPACSSAHRGLFGAVMTAAERSEIAQAGLSTLVIRQGVILVALRGKLYIDDLTGLERRRVMRHLTAPA